MHVLFEVHIAPGADPDRLLSAEVLQDSKARLLSWAEARALGFTGLAEPPAGKQVRYVSAVGRDARFIHHVLENSPVAAAIRAYELT